MSAFILWLLAGIAFMAAEALGATGIGLLFAGFGAFSVGVWLNFSPETNQITQFVIFFCATAIWAGILWKPLQRFRISKNGGYKNIIGDTAYIGAGGLLKGEVGEATWSGTIMKAELSADAAVGSLAAGEQAIIVSVTGNKLLVAPKN